MIDCLGRNWNTDDIDSNVVERLIVSGGVT
jgi:hypothetical protein